MYFNQCKLIQIDMQPDELREALVRDPSLYRNFLSYGSTVPSTPSFWFARKTELQAMVEQLGSPTIFFTLSSADHQWPELIRILDTNSDHPEYRNEFREHMRRSKLINENPMLAVWFFELRVVHFIKNVIFKKYAVRDYWFRREAQHRGSLYIHGFLWFENAPSVENMTEMSDDQLQQIT